MEDEFYISLPKKDKNQSVAALVRHALAAIELGHTAEGDITLDHFYLINAYTSDDKPSIYVKYSAQDDDTIKRKKDSLKLRAEYSDSEEQLPTVFAEDHQEGMALNGLEQRLPLNDEQGNAIRLLRETSDTLERLGDIEVKDLVLHNFLDEDGLERPYVSVYYSS